MAWIWHYYSDFVTFYIISLSGCTQPIAVLFIRPVCLLCFPLDVTSDGEKPRLCLLYFSLSSSLWFHSDSAFTGWKFIIHISLLITSEDPRVISHFPCIPSSSLSFLYSILILLLFYPSGRSGFHPRLMKKTVYDALKGLWFLLHHRKHGFPETLWVHE